MTVMCIECGEHPAWSRGLCQVCYGQARRAMSLNEYPTKAFLDDPESHARWLLGMYPHLVAEIAVEFNLRLVEGGSR